MKLIKCVLFGVLIVLSGCRQQEIQGYDVQILIDKMQHAIDEKDADLLKSLFVNDVVIEMTLPNNMGGHKTIPLDRYIRDLKKGWAMGIEQSYEVVKLDYKVSEDRYSAVVTDVVVEQAIVNGQVIMTSRTSEEFEVVLVEGEPRISKLSAVVEI